MQLKLKLSIQEKNSSRVGLQLSTNNSIVPIIVFVCLLFSFAESVIYFQMALLVIFVKLLFFSDT